jgi:hypothetical protein
MVSPPLGRKAIRFVVSTAPVDFAVPAYRNVGFGLRVGQFLVLKLLTQSLMLKCCSDVRVFGMDSGLLKVNPDQLKRLDIATETTCPQCYSTIVYRTKRKGILERILLYPLGYRAYRCEICDMRLCSRPKPPSND